MNLIVDLPLLQVVHGDPQYFLEIDLKSLNEYNRRG